MSWQVRLKIERLIALEIGDCREDLSEAEWLWTVRTKSTSDEKNEEMKILKN